jgi:hypothetical protein
MGFNSCGLKEIKFEDGSKLREIGVSAFADYRFLSAISLPEGVVVIGERAFCGCNELQAVRFGSEKSLMEVTESGIDFTLDAYLGASCDVEVKKAGEDIAIPGFRMDHRANGVLFLKRIE